MLNQLTRSIMIKDLDPEIEKRIDLDNLKFCRMMSLFVMIVEALVLIVYGFFTKPTAPWFSLRIWCYFGYFTVSAICFFLSKYVMRKFDDHRTLMIVGLGYCAIAMLWGIIISLTDYMNGKQILVFITNVVCVAGFAFIHPIIAIFMFVSVFALFYIALILFAGISVTFPTNLVFLMLMVIWISIARYQTKLSDTTARVKYEKLNQHLQKLSLYDELTGVKNRHSFSLDLSGFHCRDLFLMIVDIDDFKVLNDNYGHDYGDWQLRQFAQVLQNCFSLQNVYRYGGDEFIIALCDANHDLITEKIRLTQQATDLLEKKAGCKALTFSGGYIFREPHTKEDVYQMILCIDKALYESKRRGKNQIYSADQIFSAETPARNIPVTAIADASSNP